MSGPKTWRADGETIMREHPFIGLLAACFTSLFLHGVAYGSFAFGPREVRERPPSRVSMRVKEAPKPERAEPPKPEPPKPEPPKPARRDRAKPEPEPIAAPAPEPTPLQGVTLTNESGSGSFSSVVGDGSSFQGPLGPVGQRLEPKPTPARALPAPQPPAVPLVPLADLSEKPRPPALGDALREHYPVDARKRGVSGSASVKARIEPDGRIRTVTLVNETFPGFGDACRRTLSGSRWSPPRDREGRAVSTTIRYTCRFVVQP
jgi:TonB family protein